MRIGHGYDVHRLVPGRKLILGGVEISHHFGLLGHSDADVLTHAVMDALLGAACLGDIGAQFPDTEPEYKGVSSLILIGRVTELIRAAGWRFENVDATIMANCPSCILYSEMRLQLAAIWATVGMCQRKGNHRGGTGLYWQGGGNRRPRGLPAGETVRK